MTRGKLSREDRTLAALGAPTRGGLAEVWVEVLAKELGATCDSFYWHSTDRRARWWRRWRSGSGSTTELGLSPATARRRAVAAYTTLLGWLQLRRAVPDAAPETADGGDRSRLMLAHVVDLLVEGGKPR